MRRGIGVSNKNDRGRILSGALAIFLVFASASLISGHELSTEKIASLKRAVVIVRTYDDHGQPLLQGSGFFITPDRVVTNLHVITHASEIRIKTFVGQTFTVQAVIATDTQSDLSLLQMNGPCADATLQVEDTAPIEGESIIVLSNPVGSHWKITRGQTGPLWRFENNGDRMQITAGLLPGSSGGPVLNQQGRVIGVAVMHTASADDLNFAIPAQSLKALQASAGITSDRGSARGKQADR